MSRAYKGVAVQNRRIPIQDSAYYMMVLKGILEDAKIPAAYYSLGGYSEDAVCIENEQNLWIVYNGERGNKDNLKKYNHIINACMAMISRLAESEESENQLLQRFKRQIYSGAVKTFKPEEQVLLLTARIQELTEYLKRNPKDLHTRRSLLKLVAQRRRILYFLRKTDIQKYRALVMRLGVRG